MQGGCNAVQYNSAVKCSAQQKCRARRVQCSAMQRWGAGRVQCSVGMQKEEGVVQGRCDAAWGCRARWVQCSAVLGCSVVEGHAGAMQCNAGCRNQEGAVQCGCNAVECRAVPGAVQHQGTVQCTAAGHSNEQCSAMQCRDPLHSAVWGLYSGCAVPWLCSAAPCRDALCTAALHRGHAAAMQCSARAVQHQAAAEQCSAQGTEQDGAGCAAKPPCSPPRPVPK